MAWLDGWQYRRKLTIDSSKIDSTQTNLKVPVILEAGSPMNFDFSKILENGEDFRITSDDETTVLDYEIEDLIQGVSGDGLDDESDSAHDITASGDAHVDTDDSKVGNGSLDLDGTADFVYAPDSADWDFGSSDFCIEAWVKFNSTGTSNTVVSRTTSGGSYMYFTFESGTNLRFRDYTGVNNVDFTRSVSVTTGTWYHVAVTRSGSTFRMFLDGTQQGADYTNSNAMTARAVQLDIGHGQFNSGYAMNGRIDDLRIVVGDAVYTSNFTPSTSHLSKITGTKLLMAFDIVQGDVETAILWAEIPSVSSSVDTDFYIYYGAGSGTSDAQDKAGTWDDYTAVWHMNEILNGTTDELEDSTGNGHDGTGQGSDPTRTTGLIGYGEDGQGTGSYITAPDHNDLDLTGDFEVTWKMKWNGSITNGSIFGKSQGGGGSPKWIINYGNLVGGAMGFQGGGSTASFTWSPSADTWYHCRLLRTGNTCRFFVDGTQVGGDQSFSATVPNTTQAWHFFADGESWQWFNGVLDEVRLKNGGVFDSADRAKAEFYGDKNELLTYGDEEEQAQETVSESESITLSDDIELSLQPALTEEITLADEGNFQENSIEETDEISLTDEIDLTLITELQDEITLADEEEVSTPGSLSENEDITLTDELQTSRSIVLNLEDAITLADEEDINLDLEKLSLAEEITLTDSAEVEFHNIDEEEGIELSDEIEVVATAGTAKNAHGVLWFNPLVIVTDSVPMKVIEYNISDPVNPTFTVHTFPSLSNAKDVVYNETFGVIYVACAEGKILKINASDFNDTEIIDTGDSDDLEVLVSLEEYDRLFAGTDDTTGEVLAIDNAILSKFGVDIQCLEERQEMFATDIRVLQAPSILGLDIQVLAEQTPTFGMDIRCITDPFDEIAFSVIAQTDFHVKINGTEVDDVELDSIVIYHAIESEKSEASFRLRRRHDAPNTVIADGSTSQITNKNNVEILIQSRSEFTGKVDTWSSDSEGEYIDVTAKGTLQSDNRKTITIPMALTSEKTHPYPCFVHSPVIYNPDIDENDDNPEFFLGIQVDLGTSIKQNNSRWIAFFDVSEDVLDGTFQPLQNWTYFWFARAFNYLTGRGQLTSRYVGTSPAGLTSDIWEIESLTYRYQREFDDKETELGNFTVGSAPYKEINTRNGRKIPKDRWVDQPDGLYRQRDAGYDFVNYAKKVAQLEYNKLLTINGTILPKTSCDVELMIDGYYFYGVKLLTRINIDNTTESGIFKNSNGFPVSVKAIEINSGSMSVNLKCDNDLSTIELEEIDADYPDEDSDEYNFEEELARQFSKYDYAKQASVE